MFFELGTEHPPEYRQEIIKPIFDCIRASDSCTIVGAGSMGKTRLIDFFLQQRIREHYLGESEEEILFIRTDCNRKDELSDWGLYELMFTALIESCMAHPKTQAQYLEFNKWRTDLITNKNDLIALRYLELAISTLVKRENLAICFVFDEFDNMYTALSPKGLSNLRALRDANKNRFEYILILRNVLEHLRDINDNESFYELVSLFTFGLKPYCVDDAKSMLQQYEEKYDHVLPAQVKKYLLQISGRHPGIMRALFKTLMEKPELQSTEKIRSLVAEKDVVEECRKLYQSLPEVERLALKQLIQGNEIDDEMLQRLQLKGVLISDSSGGMKPLSPLFREYVKTVLD
jgi:hypothetical protein